MFNYRRFKLLQILDKTALKTFSQVRLVGAGVNELVSISEALRRAEDAGLDLILVSPEGTQPVVKIEDYNKIQYDKKKTRKPTKKISVKEIQLKVNISDHDLAVKITAIEKFLARGDSVKLSVRLKGREKDSPERAVELLNKVTSSVKCKISKVAGTIMVLDPAK